MAKKDKEPENYEGIEAGQNLEDYTLDEMMTLLGSGRLAWTRKGEFRGVSDVSETALSAYENYLAWKQSLDAREYNSVDEQVKRLMAAGMSRTQALLTATAGEATPPAMMDSATALNAEKTRKRDTAMQIIGNIQQLLGSTQDFINGYDNFQQIRGDALVQPIGEEIYSWLPRGIQVPDIARADAQHFKEWCLGMLKDENGKVIEPPKEAADLIHSKEWTKMASQPSGWLAFERYFNANYSTRGYHEDYRDAQRQRRLIDLQIGINTLATIEEMPGAMEASMYVDMANLQGLFFDNSSLLHNSGADINLNGVRLTFSDVDPETGNVRTQSLAGRYDFIRPDGRISEDAPALFQAFYDEFYLKLRELQFSQSADFIEAHLNALLSDEKFIAAMNELELIDKTYSNQLLSMDVHNAQFDQNELLTGQDAYLQKIPSWLRKFRQMKRVWSNVGGKTTLAGKVAEGSARGATDAATKAVIKRAAKVAITKTP